VLELDPPLIAFDDVIEMTYPFRLAAIVIAKEPPDFAPSGATDPVAIAALAASGFGVASTGDEIAAATSQRGPVVVVAAGNGGPGKLSPWAQLDWTLSVGATVDDVGSTLAPYSATAGEGAVGPDVVAHGESALSEEWTGTSFAAPNAARQIATLWTFAETVRYAAAQHAGQVVLGVPLAALGIVDSGHIPKGPTPLPRNPVAGIDSASVGKACDLLLEHGHTLLGEVRGAVVRKMLLRSADPRDQRPDSGWGAGFVSDATTAEFCLRATAADVVGVLVDDPSQISKDLLQQLAQIPIADSVSIGDACKVWRECLALILVHEETGAITVA
jgi:hypothetical protein